MTTTGALFYFFAAVLLFASFRVITAGSTVHAALYLVLAFANAAVIWMLLRAEFLAIALVLVYLGAVMVLFLFVVMMLDIRIDTVRRGFWKHFPLAALVGALVAFEMAAVLMTGFRGVEEPKAAAALVNAAGQVLPYSNTQALGKLMYSEYLYPVEIAAVILLVAMISAIALTLRQRKDVKASDVTAQINARASERLVVVKMSVTQASQAPADAAGSAQENKA